VEEKYAGLIFVDCEARGPSPLSGTMTEFGAVHFVTQDTFHGVLYRGEPDPDNPAIPRVLERLAEPGPVATEFAHWISDHTGRPTLVSDNPAFDFMWIAALFDAAGIPNPFGHSGRRIGDFYAGLAGNWSSTWEWKRWRITPHDHNPVHDAMGNVEAFRQILQLPRS
jgi:hypothetical protein